MPTESLLSRFQNGLRWLRRRRGAGAFTVSAIPRRPFNLDDSRANSWDLRAETATELWLQAVQLVRSRGTNLTQWSLADLGCGDGKLVRVLREKGVAFSYQGYDLLPQLPSVQRMDLGQEMPSEHKDMTFVLGVLEYLADPSDFFARLRDATSWAVVSYVAADAGAYSPAAWTKLGWRHHFQSAEIGERLANCGWRIHEKRCIDAGRTFLWLIEA